MAIDYSDTGYQKVNGKPCPFCGCGEIRSYAFHHSGGWTINIECSQCFAQMPRDNVEAALERWNVREYDPTLNRAVAHMKQVEWENQQLLKQMEDVKRIYKTDLAVVKREDRIAATKFYEEELRLAQQRTSMMEEALAIVKQSLAEEK